MLNHLLTRVAGRDWTQLVADGGERGRETLREQLEASGWLIRQRRRRLGLLLAAHVRLCDDHMVSGLADRMTEALRNGIEDRPADPRSLGIGLIAVQAKIPVVSGFIDNGQHRPALREMNCTAIEPILGLQRAIEDWFSDVRSQVGGGGGCCGGGS